MSFFSRPTSIFAPPPFLYILFLHPLTTIFTILHSFLLFLRGAPYRPPKNRHPIRVVTISDTHSKIPRGNLSLPQGELLIHAGDLTERGTLSEIQQKIDYLKTLCKVWPGSSDGFTYVVVIAGNHDSYFDPRSRSVHDRNFEKSRSLDWGKVLYLQHTDITLTFRDDRKLKIYGAPQIPKCGGKEFAFQYERGTDAWSNTIPDDVDILVTHNPPKWHLDIPENGGLGDEHELKECWRVKPTLHVFGHCHSGHGRESIWWDDGQRLMETIKEKTYGGGDLPPRNESLVGGIGEWFNVGLWSLGSQMVWSDIKGIFWNWLWGGARNGGWMVNAALTYQTTDKLGNKPQLVIL